MGSTIVTWEMSGEADGAALLITRPAEVGRRHSITRIVVYAAPGVAWELMDGMGKRYFGGLGSDDLDRLFIDMPVGLSARLNVAGAAPGVKVRANLLGATVS